jgi:hypothetical protein
MKLIATFLGISLTLLCFATLQADIYTWTDENGVKHYSNEPPDKDDVQVEFQEKKGNQSTVQQNQQRPGSQQREMDKLIRDIEADYKREEAEQRRKANAARKNQTPNREQRIAAEEKRLSEKIAELEEAPLEKFGSQKNKRSQIGFYKYRLDALRENPDKYFNEPESFEGNVKAPAGSGASN